MLKLIFDMIMDTINRNKYEQGYKLHGLKKSGMIF